MAHQMAAPTWVLCQCNSPGSGPQGDATKTHWDEHHGVPCATGAVEESTVGLGSKAPSSTVPSALSMPQLVRENSVSQAGQCRVDLGREAVSRN